MKKIDKLSFRHYTPSTGHPDMAACQEEAVELSGQIAPLIRKNADLTATDRMRDVSRKASALRKSAENYFVNRRRFQAGDHALRPLYVIWTTTNKCNFRCTYCDNHQGQAYFDVPDPARLSTSQGKRLLDVMITGTPALYWCGGEPTLRKDLPELLDHAWELGFFPNMINTNGSLFHKLLLKPAWKNFLWQMDMVILSLDGLDMNRLGKLWGVKNARKAARQVVVNLLLLRLLRDKIKFKLAVNTVITLDTIDEARAVLDLACDLDLWFVPVPVNIHHRPDRALLSDVRYRELAELILERKKNGAKIIGSAALLRRLLFAEPYQCLTALKPHVWSSGEICWPCRASVNVEPAAIQLLDYESFDEAYRAGAEQINPNFFHGPAKNQCGGDCAWMQNYTTARYLDGITQPLKSGFLGELHEFVLSRRA